MRAGLRKIDGEIRTWSGVKIFARSKNDLRALDLVYITKPYETKLVRVPYNSVVFDVGAHIGTFSLYAAKVRKAKRVYSYEPFPENYATLSMNVQNNHLEKIIEPIPKAIYAETGLRDLFISDENDRCNSLLIGNQQAKTVKVECITLKQALEENHVDYVDYLKMNCEGAEWDILKTIDDKTISKIGVIGMEFHLKPREEFEELLLQLGFSVLDSKKEILNSQFIIASRN